MKLTNFDLRRLPKKRVPLKDNFKLFWYPILRKANMANKRLIIKTSDDFSADFYVQGMGKIDVKKRSSICLAEPRKYILKNKCV
jgi:hypothetical protein